MTKTITTGTRVRVQTTQLSPSFGPSNGMEGVVIDAPEPWSNDNEIVLVEFEGFDKGHDGEANYDRDIKNRWYLAPEQLVVISAPKPKRKSKPKATNTKIAKIRAHLLSGRSLTQLEAIGLYGAFRLAARIHDLKADGMKIVTRMKEDPNGNPYAEYQLRSPWVKG